MNEQAHILVVDDDPSIRRMLQLLLQETGYRVSNASSGEEALAYMDLVTPDLVLMDLMLPGINGQQVTEQIKAQPDKPFVPVILVTARNDPKSKVTALDAGADDFWSSRSSSPSYWRAYAQCCGYNAASARCDRSSARLSCCCT
ncbi:MAG: response regulator [Kouleothrix sp.]